MVKRYIIYHPEGGALNTDCIGGFKYHPVANVETHDDLESVFFNAQNDHSLSYAVLGIRSTSVGDIISQSIALNKNLSVIRCYMILDVGFKEVHYKYIM